MNFLGQSLVLWFVVIVLFVAACATCFGAGPAYPMYGPNGAYKGYYTENPYNKNYNVYNQRNVYQGRYAPSYTSRYNIYDMRNLYGGAIVIPNAKRR